MRQLSQEYPVMALCDWLDVPRSSYYYQPRSGDDSLFRTALKRVAGEWPTYGYRRLTVQMRREEKYVVNGKKVRRYMQLLGLKAKVKRQKRCTTNSQHDFPRYPNLVEGLEIVRPDQVWVADITYIGLRLEFVYLAILLDVFTRCIRGWFLGRSLEQELTLIALKRALQNHVPEIHHSDQGVQYAATAYVEALQAHAVAISMAEIGQAWQNGYAERFMKTIKEEEVDLSDYQDYEDAYRQMGRFLDDVYMYKRIHSSLGYLTPAEFESQWLKEQAEAQLCSFQHPS
jgi:transposase InsO family protein